MRGRLPTISGGNVEGAIPDPIPNSVVKPFRADGTARVIAWESRSLPGYFEGLVDTRGPFFCSTVLPGSSHRVFTVVTGSGDVDRRENTRDFLVGSFLC